MEEINLYPEEILPVPEDQLEIFRLGDDAYRTTLSAKYRNKKEWEPVNLKVIKAQIPGIIRKAYVKIGAKVKIGDKLVVLEAMKMKNDILSTDSGVVEEICVKIGERVPKDAVLVRLK
jgi:biotin carboxyl carrier protein